MDGNYQHFVGIEWASVEHEVCASPTHGPASTTFLTAIVRIHPPRSSHHRREHAGGVGHLLEAHDLATFEPPGVLDLHVEPLATRLADGVIAPQHRDEATTTNDLTNHDLEVLPIVPEPQ